MKNIFADVVLLIVRLVFGGLMLLNHGMGKLNKLVDFLNGQEVGFRSVLGLGEIPSLFLAVFAEVGCAAMLILGFQTKKASWPLIATMFIAAFVVHGSDPLKKKEMALLYLTAFLVTAVFGGGKYSLDRVWLKRR